MLVVVLVLSILVPLLVAGAIFAYVLVRKIRSKRTALAAELQTEPALRGPESGIYRGSTGAYPKAFGNGLIALTQRRLIFRKMLGVGIDVALADVTGVTTQKTFNRSVVGNRVHLVVHTRNGDVGYFVSDNPAWVAAIRHAAGVPEGDAL